VTSSLGRNFKRFEGWLTTTTGVRFRGCVLPASDTVAASSLLQNRLLLRTRPLEPVAVGALITDSTGRVFLLGEDDTQLDDGTAVAKTFRMFRMTVQASWKRLQTDTDPVTNLPQRNAFAEIGPLWCAIEILSSIDIDRGTHMAAEKRHVITGAAVQLQDKIDGNTVKRVTPTFGVYVAEIE
jgi:hypothetical protein